MSFFQKTPESILADVFGYDAFRGHQSDVIHGIIAGKDAAVIMPTGSGKSLCYQIPALLRPGVGVVISPLIALMDDQVAAARSVGISAAALNSTMDPQDVYQVEQALQDGALDLLFIAPERANTPSFQTLLSRCNVALIAIDEAHCVSQWGHDFRPDYRQIGGLCARLEGVPRVALTATADVRTQSDILQQLSIADDRLFVSGFDRTNIFYNVGVKTKPMDQLRSFLSSQPEGAAGIVYCQTRNRVNEVAAALVGDGYNALPYHAGLDPATRSGNQAKFLREDGIIMVATVAFGMGINKPDVRFVAHLDLPKTIEAYYQETGRAGRDGEPATAWMVYGGSDVAQARRFITQSGAEDAQKQLEMTRLNALIAYCETVECRRRPLLSYFGDKHEGKCGQCDTCLSPPDQIDISEDMQKLLSAVYRTGQRYGLHYVVDVLRGQGGEKAEKFGHDKLGLYGLGEAKPKASWLAVGQVALSKGYLVDNGEGYGGLCLTAEAKPALKGETPVFMRKDTMQSKAQIKTSKKKSTIDLPPEAEPLFEVLRAWRRDEAKAQDVPAYVIFPDATLKAIAMHRPATAEDLLAIAGIGAKKIEKYGGDVLSAVGAH